MGVVVRGNYLWCFDIFATFMEFGGAEVGNALKSSFGGSNTIHKRGAEILKRNRGGGRWMSGRHHYCYTKLYCKFS